MIQPDDPRLRPSGRGDIAAAPCGLFGRHPLRCTRAIPTMNSASLALERFIAPSADIAAGGRRDLDRMCSQHTADRRGSVFPVWRADVIDDHRSRWPSFDAARCKQLSRYSYPSGCAIVVSAPNTDPCESDQVSRCVEDSRNLSAGPDSIGAMRRRLSDISGTLLWRGEHLFHAGQELSSLTRQFTENPR